MRRLHLALAMALAMTPALSADAASPSGLIGKPAPDFERR
jgi:hypothetical protein